MSVRKSFIGVGSNNFSNLKLDGSLKVTFAAEESKGNGDVTRSFGPWGIVELLQLGEGKPVPGNPATWEANWKIEEGKICKIEVVFEKEPPAKWRAISVSP